MKLFCRHLYKRTGKYCSYKSFWGWDSNYEYICIYCGRRKWLDYLGYDNREGKYYKIIQN